MGIAGFILGLISFFFNPIGIPSVIAVIFSSISLCGEYRGLAIAGLILGILGIAATIFEICVDR